MMILLPPSETKVDGGADGAVLDLALLGHPRLSPQRRSALSATRALSRNLTTMAEALRLGPNQHFELLRNRAIRHSPVMPALERYTGVLYDSLGAQTLSRGVLAFAGEHVVIHSALFGLLRASDQIPAYRVSHDSRLPGLRLRELWKGPIAAELGGYDGLILDLRSEAYVSLGPAPRGAQTFFLRVVSVGADGRRRALNHFNKKGKGALVRAILEEGIDYDDVDSLLGWAERSGFGLTRGADGELELAVDSPSVR